MPPPITITSSTSPASAIASSKEWAIKQPSKVQKTQLKKARKQLVEKNSEREAIKGEVTLNELCTQYEVAPSQVGDWKKQFLEQGHDFFNKKSEIHVCNTIVFF